MTSAIALHLMLHSTREGPQSVADGVPIATAATNVTHTMDGNNK
jgi:hypothetical protein